MTNQIGADVTLEDPLQIHGYFRVFRPHPPVGWWFRGQANSAWKLVPRAGRPEYFLKQTKNTSSSRDVDRFNYWKKSAIAYIPTLPENDWECLALAQHHGLATRLLDWSYNPLVALFFACWELPDSEGCVYCYDPPSFVKESILPLNESVVGVGFIPRALSSRILNQRGLFTVHGPPTEEILSTSHPYIEGAQTLAKLRIPAAMKPEVLKALDVYGINRVTLFPDLDGLCAHVNYETRSLVKRRPSSRI